MKIDYAILSAMPEELEFLINKFSNLKYTIIKINELTFKIYDYKNTNVLISHTGIGTGFAASVLTFIHAHFNPEYFLVAGTAGGIGNNLKLRDVIIAESAFEAEMLEIASVIKGTPFENCLIHPLNNKRPPNHYPGNAELLSIFDSLNFGGLTIHKGTIVSSNAFPAPKELFEKIKCLNPYCIDMETSAFYQTAWLLNLKILCVRGISNILNSDGSDDMLHESDLKGSSLAAATVLHAILDASIALKNHMAVKH